MFTNSEIAHDISNVIVKIDERIYAVCDGDYYKSDFYSETELHRDTNIFKAFHFIFFFFFFFVCRIRLQSHTRAVCTGYSHSERP